MSYYYPIYLNGHTGFILDKLILKKHPIFGENFKIDFKESDDFKRDEVFHNPYTSLIIGSNGTGKSLLLKEISDIFIGLKISKDKKDPFSKYINSYFYLSYYLGGDFIEVSNFEEIEKKDKINSFKRISTTLKINNFEMNINDINLPQNILTSSLLLNDRFTINNTFPDYYKYLGVRTLNSPSVARTKNYIKRTIDLIFNKLSNFETEINFKIKELLFFLDYQEVFRIQYTPKYKNYFYNGNLTVNRFIQLFENYNNSELGFSNRKDSDFIPFGVNHFNNKVKKDSKLIEELVTFLNYIPNSDLYVQKNNSKSSIFEIDILNKKLNLDQYKLIKELQSLDLLTYPTIILEKNDCSINLEQTSSGEYHILSNLIGIYASISHNSILLLDEPEISLHPNWQMKYMTFLKKIFNDYSSCHFIITTHSHFFASDLDGRNSKIIGLKRDDDNKIKTVHLPKDLNTYGWSAEDVLYNVFNVASTRNKFVAEDIAEILDFLSAGKKDGENKISRARFEELIKLDNSLKENDPLKMVVKSILTKIK